jgi:hypothetical protein
MKYTNMKHGKGRNEEIKASGLPPISLLIIWLIFWR